MSLLVPPSLAAVVARPHAAPAQAPGRRRALCAGALSLLAAFAPARAAFGPAGATQLWRRPRLLWVTRPEAGEAVRVVYWANGAIEPAGYAALNHIYRDVAANAQHPIALGLLDLNFALQLAVRQLVGPRPLVLLSGYRTAATNARVGGTEPNVHGQGIADDFRYEGLSLIDTYRLARRFQVGGLGLYPDRGSLHKDIGRFRSWVTPGRQPGLRHGHASFR